MTPKRPRQHRAPAAKSSDGGAVVLTRAEQVEKAIEAVETVMYERHAATKAGMTVWSLRRALAADPEAKERFETAQRLAYDRLHEEAHRIAAEPNPDGSSSFESQRRTRIDTIKWSLQRLYRQRYGDNVDVTTRGDAMPPAVIILPTLDDEVQA